MARMSSDELAFKGISGAFDKYFQDRLDQQNAAPQTASTYQSILTQQQQNDRAAQLQPLEMERMKQQMALEQAKASREAQTFQTEQGNQARMEQFRKEVQGLGDVDLSTPEGRNKFNQIAMKYVDVIPEFRTVLGNATQQRYENLDQLAAEIQKRGPKTPQEASFLDSYMKNRWGDQNMTRALMAQAAILNAGTRANELNRKTGVEDDVRRKNVEDQVGKMMQYMIPKALAQTPGTLPVYQFLHDLAVYRAIQKDPSLQSLYPNLTKPPQMPPEIQQSLQENSAFLGGLRGYPKRWTLEAQTNYPEYTQPQAAPQTQQPQSQQQPANSEGWQDIGIPGVRVRTKP